MGLGLEECLGLLKEAELGSLPGTAAEVLNPEVRSILCPEKISADQWIQVWGRSGVNPGRSTQLSR